MHLELIINMLIVNHLNCNLNTLKINMNLPLTYVCINSLFL